MTLTAQALANRRGVSVQTIRRWVRDGLLTPLPRPVNGRLAFARADAIRMCQEVLAMGIRYDEQRARWVIDTTVRHPTGRKERIRLDSPVNTRDGAEDYCAQVRESVARGLWHKSKRNRTYARFVADWLETLSPREYKPSTLTNYEQVNRTHLVPFLGRHDLGAIDMRAIAKLRANLEGKGLATKTINNILIVLAVVLGAAVDHGLLASRPEVGLLRDRQVKKVDYLTSAELAALVDAAGSPRNASMILFAAHTGLRLGELEALEWQHITPHCVLVRQAQWRRHIQAPKTGPRDVALNGEARRALEMAVRRIDTPYVWPTRTGRPLDHSAARDLLCRACRRAGLREIGWHTLRHTFASHLAMAGVTLYDIAALLGHRDVSTTQIYAHLAPDHLAAAVARLEG